jgi:hypothetical protein
VRVEAAHEDARRLDVKRGAQALVQDRERALEQNARDRLRHARERQVRGRERDAKLSGDQQHHGMGAAGARSQVFRVALKAMPASRIEDFWTGAVTIRGEAAAEAAVGRCGIDGRRGT